QSPYTTCAPSRNAPPPPPDPPPICHISAAAIRAATRATLRNRIRQLANCATAAARGSPREPPMPIEALMSASMGIGGSLGLPLRSEEHTSELQSRFDRVCRPLLGQK